MRPTGYLGGDVSMRERYKLRDRYLAGLPRIAVTWKDQCRCGSQERVLWRKRFYCPTCARWTRKLNADVYAPRQQ